MIVCIAPAKYMAPCMSPYPLSIPSFNQQSKILLKQLKQLNTTQLAQIYSCNLKIAQLNRERFMDLEFDELGTAAFLTYNGMQFKAIKHHSLNDEDLEYSNEHIRIMSAFYGYLKPFDSIYPYRLDMNSKLNIKTCKTLYDFWNDQIARMLLKEVNEQSDHSIVDLCSNEFSLLIQPYLKTYDNYYKVGFLKYKKGKLVCEATQSKQARGRMVHWVVANRINTIEQLKRYQEDGYQYQADISKAHELFFVQVNQEACST